MWQELTTIPEDINILLLGDNDVGKSTFIQAFANYMKYDQFTKAEEKVIRLFPTPLFRTDTSQNFSSSSTHSSKTVGFYNQGSKNCNQQEEQSIDEIVLNNTCSYIFPLPKYGRRMHLIDTPGFKVDSEILEDKNKFEDVLSYISYMEHLHAICLVLKPSSSYSKLHLEYRIKFLLSVFEKSARKNIIFLITHSGNIDHSQGDPEPLLKEIFNQIRSASPPADVECGKENVFYVDNEAFHFLESSKNVANFNDVIKANFGKIWKDSVAECWRMIEYILGKGEGLEEIIPHNVENTIKLYNSKQIVTQLSQSLVDIRNILDHLEKCSFILTNANRSNLKVKEEPAGINSQKICSASHCDFFIFNKHLGEAECNRVRGFMSTFENEKSKYAVRKEHICKSLENFAVFVKSNAILPCNDAHAAYIRYLITEEIQNADGNTNVMKYHDALKQYAEETRIINTKYTTASQPFTVYTMLRTVQLFTELENFKNKFQQLHDDRKQLNNKC